MSSSEVVPPLIEGDRFAVITNDDHTGILWIVAILCFIYTVMIFFLRLEARRKNFGVDDIFAIVGTLFASIQYVLILLAIKYGLGKSYQNTTAEDAEMMGKYMYASQILLLLALGFAKCSVICLCRRLFSAHVKTHRIVCDVAMGLCIAWAIASSLAITIDCSPIRMLGYNTDLCHNLITRWMAIGILDSITEVAIVAMAFEGLWPLQMSIARKIQALATFVLRLIIIVFAALHITTLRDATSAANRGIGMTLPTVWLQVELLYALLSASIPALNRWLRNFDTSTGMAWLQTSQAYSLNNSKSRSGSHSIPLESIDRQPGQQSKRASRISLMSKTVPKRASTTALTAADFVPPGPKYSVSTEAYPVSQSSETQERGTSDSMNSEDMIIRKDVQWHVQYEHDGSVHRGSNS